MAGEIERAIEDIEECRANHVGWAEWMEANPDEVLKQERRTVGDALGDAEWHRDWAARYENVLACLRNGARPT